MANTTNLNLSKLAGTEKLKTFPSMNNDNLDAIDGAFGSGFGLNGNPNVNASINNLGDGVAILANGNTHAAITSGWFVYIRNHASLSEGLYRATANISANGTLSGSNVTADTNGGLNTVYNELNSNIANMIAQTDSATYVRFNNSSTNTEYRLNVTQDGQLLLGSRVGSGNWNLIDITSALEFGTDKAFTGDIDSTNITPGQYHLGSSSSYTHASITSNVPEYCIFIQFSYTKLQVIFTGGNIFTRKYSGNPASWSTWKIFA